MNNSVYCSMFNFAASPQNLEMESTVPSDWEHSSCCCDVELMNYDHDEWSIINPSNLPDQTFPAFASPLSSLSLSPLGDLDSLEDYISKSEVSYGAMSLHDIDTKSMIQRWPMPSLDQRIMKALHLCTKWFGGGTLAQVWVPTRSGGEYVLSTIDQPFLHDGTLSGYREISRFFTFAMEPGTSSLLGLPGRVFVSKVPEWTSNVMYYNQAEYLRVRHAIDHDVRGSIALPVFEDDSNDRSCCAVLEIVTTEEKPDFDEEMESVCRALQAVDLSSRRSPWLSPKSLSSNQNAALAEIKNILHTVCLAHRLPLALTWISGGYTKNNVVENETSRGHVGEESIAPILVLEETACYWSDARMEGFVRACMNRFIEEGKGLVGKALQSNEPFFYPDVKEFDVSEYPLVHHARKLGLSGAVAIRLSGYAGGDNDYVLEFFLPVNMARDEEQVLLVSKLLESIERICTSPSHVSDSGLVEETKPDIRLIDGRSSNMSKAELLNEEWRNDPPKKTTVRLEKKGKTSEKIISLSVLQQYFSGNLKDAAKGLGVCPTTLKRICRQHGISRWPSRKIKKVDYSLKKIQSMLESVPGMEGGGLELKNFLTGKSDFYERSDTVITSEVIDVEWNDEPKHNVRRSSKGTDFRDESRFTVPSVAPNTSCLSKQAYSDTTTDSSNVSEPLLGEAGCEHSGTTKITVKAVLGENTVRFKFEPGAGCFELYSEVAKRLGLLIGEFQLKYLDDDEEWVLLVTDSDLIECLDVLEVLQTRTVKFGVAVATRNSGTNSRFLASATFT